MKLLVKIKDGFSAYAYCVYSVDELTADICKESTRIFASDDREEFLKFIGGSVHQILEAWDKVVDKL